MFDKPTPKPSRKLVSGATTFVHLAHKSTKFKLVRFPDTPKRTENVQAIEDSSREEERRRECRFSQSAPKNPRA